MSISFILNKHSVHLRLSSIIGLISLTLSVFNLLCSHNVYPAADLQSRYLCGLISCDPIPVAMRSKAWVCSCLIAGITGLKSLWGHECLSLVFVVCCEGSGLCDGLITRPEESWSRVRSRVCLIVCDIETSTMRRPRAGVPQKKIRMNSCWSDRCNRQQGNFPCRKSGFES